MDVAEVIGTEPTLAPQVSNREVDADRDRQDTSYEEREDKRFLDDRGKRSESFRRNFKKAVEEVNGKAEAPEDDEHDEPEHEDVQDHEVEHDEPEQAQVPEPESNPAPSAWSKEARAEWSKMPPKAREAVLKRERDVERGVEHLKNQFYQAYEAPWAPLQPHLRAIGTTTPQFAAQAANLAHRITGEDKYQAAQTIADIAKTSKIPPEILSQALTYAYQQPEQPLTAQSVSQIINQQLSERDQRAEQQRAQAEAQMQAKAAEETAKAKVEEWSQDMPYFDQVRVMMGHLLTPDPETGRSPIDASHYPSQRAQFKAAYEAAIYATPDIRARVLAEQRAKEERAQHDRNSRRLGHMFMGPTTPSREVSRGTNGQQRGLSVRDSLKAAIAEVNGR